MLSDANTPSEYIDQLDDDWRREKLQQIRALIKQEAPRLEERIHYKMLGYCVGDTYAFHLNAQRGYVSLYVGNASKVDPDGELLEGLNVGKGCIRFTKSKKVEETRIDEFIARAFDMWRKGEDIDC
ncbi:iron chaperone [Puniceibacterium sediminis]|uniref:Uncharacterized conserved protein YdhG, YjbR/CyaY-like superfamily, DUF1801 family n=1 Tax=Puniceibacterium sediminis TaxID=1608407 RepID=A0A238Z432_9RHOB|nr:DUF1801 domain-containing protein [Puniceibacterium sediminis]SNR77644.1 Uncharacterized conserved protein YdhG, YjbR/CyaY-like superfamily, DUF1801 family [Puniceibacterium sediminis]